MRRAAVGPADRFRICVIPRDVATDLARQVGDGRKDAPREQVALDLTKPELDLIQPRRVRAREVQVDAGMRLEESLHTLRLVGGAVVDNHMNLTSGRLSGDEVAQELDERRTPVARHGLSDDLA